MNYRLLQPPPTRLLEFGFSQLGSYPEVPGCYALANAEGEILYVGQAASLRGRLGQHLENGRHRALTTHGRASQVALVELENRQTLNAHERGWLNQCELADGSMPVLNKISAPI